MLENIKDKTRIKIIDLLKSYPEGLTITDIIRKLGLSRHTILARLHGLVGEGKVGIRQINMAKLHYWKGDGIKAVVEDGASEKEKQKDVDKIKQEKPRITVKIKPIKEEHIKTREKSIEAVGERKKKTKEEEKENQKGKLDLRKIKQEIQEAINGGKLKKKQGKFLEQRAYVKHLGEKELKEKKKARKYVITGVPGFDELLEDGIPEGASVIVAGGAGSGKSIFCLQTLAYHASRGKRCLYMSFEESEKRLHEHMNDFGWAPEELEKKDLLKIQRFNPFDITRNVDALLAKQKGELYIDIEPIIIPKDFKPDFIVVDSLTAISSAFTGKEESYRIYIEQLFRFFEKIGATSFLVTETQEIPKIFSPAGVEEFLADGVIVLYNIKHANVRESAIEVLKLRGAGHQKKIVAMQITDEGIVVYPEQEVFSSIGESE